MNITKKAAASVLSALLVAVLCPALAFAEPAEDADLDAVELVEPVATEEEAPAEEPVEELALEAQDSTSGQVTYKVEGSYITITGLASSAASATSVTIPQTISGKTVTKIAPAAFANKTSMQTISMPSTVKSIGSQAFMGCTALKSVSLPTSLVLVDTSTFQDCTSLTSVTIPSSVTTINPHAFSGCTSLGSITVPKTVTTLGDYAFSGCTSLSSVSLPSGLKAINPGLFYGCLSLGTVTIPSTVTSIGMDAFNGCLSLSTIKLPNSVTSIGQNAFGRCTSLASVTIPSGVTRIENDTFSGCESLASVTIPSKVTSIGDRAFAHCTALDGLTLPSKLTSIGNDAFENCTSLDQIDIPATVKTIGDKAFYNCSSLVLVEVPEATLFVGDSAFTKLSDPSVVHVPTAEMGNKLALTVSPYTHIVVGSVVDFTQAQVAPIDPQPYTGSAVEPATVVTLGGETLAVDVDYVAAYRDNVERGVATVTLLGIGDNYGRIDITFAIFTPEDVETANPVSQAIDALPAYDPAVVDADPASYVDPVAANRDAIAAADTAYQALTQVQQMLVGQARADKLADDVESVAIVDQYLIDKANADSVSALIEALPDASAIVATDRGQVLTASDAFDALNAKARALVPQELRDKLAACEAAISAFKVWSRLSGPIALDTMASIVQEGWSTSGTVIIATSSGYYDALAAAPLAGVNNAPILLTRKTALSQQTRSEIERLHPSKAIIVGGTAAVSQDVENQIAAMGITVERAAGDNAQLTAVEIANKAAAVQPSSTCIVATSKSYHDALAIAPYAYGKGVPIYLTNNKGQLRDDVAATIQAGGYTNAVVVGGEGVIPASTKQQLEGMGLSVERLWGENALVTANEIANWCVTTQGMSADKMGVATAGGYHDALAGAALCGKNNSVLVLINKAGTNLYGVDHFVTDNRTSIVSGYIFGGEAAVNAGVADALDAATSPRAH